MSWNESKAQSPKSKVSGAAFRGGNCVSARTRTRRQRTTHHAIINHALNSHLRFTLIEIMIVVAIMGIVMTHERADCL